MERFGKIAVTVILIIFICNNAVCNQSDDNLCPCEAPITLGVFPSKLLVMDKDTFALRFAAMKACHNWREELGIKVNYCAEPFYLKLQKSNNLSINELIVANYYKQKCTDFIENNGIKTINDKPDYERAAHLKIVEFDRQLDHKGLIIAGYINLSFGLFATIFSIVDLNRINKHSYSLNAWGFSDARGLDRMANLIYFTIAGIEDAGGAVLISFGYRKTHKFNNFTTEKNRILQNIGNTY